MKKKEEITQVKKLLHDIAQLLLSWSWEGVVGYEELLTCVSKTYGYDDIVVNFEAQSATIVLNGEISFVKGGIPGFPPMAYTQNLKNIFADIFAGKLSIIEAQNAIKELSVKEGPYKAWLIWLGIIIVSMGFAVDVVGTWEGVLWAGITGMFTGLAFIAADRISGFNKIVPLVATLGSGIIVLLASKFGWTAAAPGLLLVSSTFVFIPGDSISTQATELAEGRWSAGVDRLFYSIIMLVLQVAGAFIAVALTGSALEELFPAASDHTFPWWAAYPGRFVFVIGIMYAFQMSKKQFLPAIIVLWIVTGVAQISTILYGEIAGTFIATIVGTIIAILLSRGPKSIPVFVIMIPIIFALSPGSHGLRQLETWMSEEKITGVTDLTTLISILLAIGIGIVVGRAIAHRWSWMKNLMRS
jgi:uncharacterized membrane protein YjjP (DUF1212 family)/uncharacterized membrane protein YjjB (DUF3815 family)